MSSSVTTALSHRPGGPGSTGGAGLAPSKLSKDDTFHHPINTVFAHAGTCRALDTLFR